MTALAPRPYQESALSAIDQAVAAGVQRPLVALPTGTGKTILFGHFIQRRGGQALVLAHREELITQAVEKMRSIMPDKWIGIMKAERCDHLAEIIVGSVQTLCRPNRLAQLPGGIRTIVVDECFPAGVMIGERAIETIRPGDSVPAWDQGSGRIVSGKVARVFARRPVQLVRVWLGTRSIVCTAGHPFRTPHGWVPAAGTCGDMVLCTTHEMPHMQRRDHRAHEEPAFAVPAGGPGLLQPGVQSRIHGGQILRHDGTYQSQVRIQADEGSQSDARSGGSREDADHAASHGLEAHSAGWEWQTASIAADSARIASRLGYGSFNPYENGARLWISDELQAGYRGPSIASGNRDRWGESFRQETPRSKEGSALGWARVDRIEVLESGSDGRFGGLCPTGLVYNFEVEGLHTYIADGFVVHNCHHAVAQTYRDILTALGAFESGGPVALGVTATPMRGDKVGLGHVFEKIVYDRTLLEMIAEGWLCDLRAKQIRLKEFDPSTVRTHQGDFQSGDLGQALMHAGAPEVVAQAWQDHAKERKGLVFTPTIEMAHACARELQRLGIKAEAVDGMTDTELRRNILVRLRSGETQVVANCAVLTEGFDEPSIQCVMMARPTKSQTLFLQCIGRGTRTYPGKKDCLILDLHGNTSRHDLMTLAKLTGLSLDAMQKAEGSVVGALQAQQQQGKRVEVQGRLVAIDVDLVRKRRMNWTQGQHGRMALSLGQRGTLVIEPRPEGVHLLEYPREGPPVLVREIASLEVAVGYAEALASEAGAWVLNDKNAKWRQQPPSQKQIDVLIKHRIPFDSQTLTKGEASNLIDAMVLRKKIASQR